ncbi:uncharacterized protein EI90DRAFT_3167797 [Cantharellus anzutake]|uniref:uncharacterized protein n=1 Tax=Cantharellus anzutake TaxID=1750568 RepID=UPI001906FF8D|nr:uncharacterized protein EI90DRAFT_3167797 [Cantharellus anzutake]KAF8317846.1 hypothetical protein EI90DRAFT_3167797 [Cantharellus anzutake]
MDVTTGQFSSLSIHSSDDRETDPERQGKQDTLQLKPRPLMPEYMLAHEPWSGPWLPPEYVQSMFSDPPLMYFGIGLQFTATDMLPLAQALGVPTTPGEGKSLLLLENIYMAVRKSIRDKFKSRWPVKSRGVISHNTEVTRVISISNNTLDTLSHRCSAVDDHPDSIKWKELQNAADALCALTGREPKWYIGDRNWP